VTLSGLSSAWVAFIVATASFVKPMGRMAFVVPAEIGPAPYATALMDYLLSAFSTVQVIAIRGKLSLTFPKIAGFSIPKGVADEPQKSSSQRLSVS
jgi:adenine-specific DNA-methyltransferase